MSITILTLLSMSTLAHAAPSADLSTSITSPGATQVGAYGAWQVRTSNTGTRDAAGVVLTIQLPETHTSPQVYVLGDVGSMSSTCAASGTTLVCNLGTVRKGRSKTVSFTYAARWSADPLVIETTASTSSSEANTANNGAQETASVTYPDLLLSGPHDVVNRHCTGTSLSAFAECERFPSSISSHEIVLHADGSITFAGANAGSGYTGSWWQPSDHALSFEYYDPSLNLAAEFSGDAVDGSCFEGLTTFPGSSWVSPYEVCVQ